MAMQWFAYHQRQNGNALHPPGFSLYLNPFFALVHIQRTNRHTFFTCKRSQARPPCLLPLSTLGGTLAQGSRSRCHQGTRT